MTTPKVATRRPVERRLLQRLLQAPAPKVEELLFDPVTALPTLALLLPDIRAAVAKKRSLGLLTVSIAQFTKLEQVYGWENFDRIVRGVAACLKSVKGGAFRTADRLGELTVNGNVFILLLSSPRTKRL